MQGALPCDPAVRSVVLYHCPCADGAFAALAVWLNFRASDSLRQLALVPHSPNSPVSLEALRTKYPQARSLKLLDYCGPSADFIHQACALFSYVLLVDHHKTAYDVIPSPCDGSPSVPIEGASGALNGHASPTNFDYTINMTKSGCMLAALRYCYKELGPTAEFPRLKMLFAYVQDNDLWKHALTDSLAFTAGLAFLRLDYDGQRNPGIWETLVALDPQQLIKLGKPEVELQDKRIAELTSAAYWLRTPQGELLYAVETRPEEHAIRSRLGNVLAKGIRADAPPIAPCPPAGGGGTGGRGTIGAAYYAPTDGTTDKWCVSLRSIGDAVDTTVLAKRYGRGGHANASGCMIPKAEWESWKVV